MWSMEEAFARGKMECEFPELVIDLEVTMLALKATDNTKKGLHEDILRNSVS